MLKAHSKKNRGKNKLRTVKRASAPSPRNKDHQKSAFSLINNESTYRHLLENSRDVIYKFDFAKKGYLYVSPSSSDILGIKPEVFLKNKWGILTPLLHPQDKAKVSRHMKELFSLKSKRNKSFYIEYRIKMPSGEYKWLSDNHTVVFVNSKAESIVGNISDITFRKNAQEELLKSFQLQKGYMNLLTSIQDALPAHIAMLDNTGNIITVNEAWRVFAKQNNFFADSNYGVGLNYVDICRKAKGRFSDEGKPVSMGIKKVLSGKLKEYQLEYPCHSATERRWFRLIVTPISSRQKKGVVVMHLDTTEKKIAELALVEREEQYRQLFEEDLTGNYVANTDGEVLLCNSSFLKLFGYVNKKKVIGCCDFRIFNDDFSNKDFLNRLKKHEKIPVHEREITRKDGKKLTVIENILGNYDLQGELCSIQGYILDISRIKEAQNALQEKAKEIALLYDSGKELSGSLDTNEIYNKIYKIISKVIPCDSMLISSFDNDRKKINCLAAWIKNTRLDETKFVEMPLDSTGVGLQSRAILSGKSILLEDISESVKKDPHTIYIYTNSSSKRKLGKYDKVNRSALIVPMVLKGNVIGVIQVFSYQKGLFNKEHLDLLEALSVQISAATANARLYQQAENEIKERAKAEFALGERTREISVLYEAQKKLTETLDLDSVYDNSYKIVSELMPCDSMIICSFSKKDELIKFRCVWNNGIKQDVTKVPVLPLAPEGYGIQSRVIRTGKSILTNDYKNYFKKSINKFTFTKNNRLAKFAKSQYTSALIVPMMLGGEVIGTLQVLSNNKGSYKENDLRMLESLTAPIAAATANAKLYQQAQAEIAEKEKAQLALKKQSDEIILLHEAERDLSSSLDTEIIYEKLYYHLKKIIKCESMIISSYSPDDNFIRCTAAWIEDVRHDHRSFPPIPLPEITIGTQGEAIKTGKSMIVNNFDEIVRKSSKKHYFDERGNVIDFEREQDNIDNSAQITKSAMFVPMKLGESVIGVITALSFEPNAYTERDLRTLELLSKQVTAATVNAVLYQKAQNEIKEKEKAENALKIKTNELSILYEAQKKLSGSLDIDKVYENSYKTINEIMPCDSMLISSFDHKTQMISIVAAWADGQRPSISLFKPLPLAPEGSGIQSSVIRTGEPRLILDYSKQYANTINKYTVSNREEGAKGPVYSSALVIPMKMDDKAIGVIQVLSYKDNAYNENDLRILESLAGSITAATLNASLYQQAQAEIAERINKENEITQIRENLEEAQRIAHIGSWVYYIDEDRIYNSDEIFRILKIKNGSNSFSFDTAMSRVHDEDRNTTRKKLINAIKTKSHYVNEDRIVRPDGEVRYVKIVGEPIIDHNSNIKGMQGTMQDITDIKLINDELLRSVAEKELMLKEIHHRVKNNLQVVSSLLRLQADTITDEAAIGYLKMSEQRVRSMALIHQQLYRTKDLTKIDFRQYLDELCNYLFFAYDINRSMISLTIEVEEIYFAIDTALPCGLIINELVTNSLKHAFKESHKGNITVSLSKISDGKNKLVIKDNGKGAGNLDFENSTTLGMELVKTLTEQLEGEITVKTEDGTEICISFYDQHIKSR